MKSLTHRIEGDVHVWWDGGIRLRAISSHGDPVDLADESALELAEMLLRLPRMHPRTENAREDGRGARVAAVHAARPVSAPFEVFVIDEDVGLWSDGASCVKAVGPSGEAVALSDEAALDLVEALIRVARRPAPAPVAR